METYILPTTKSLDSSSKFLREKLSISKIIHKPKTSFIRFENQNNDDIASFKKKTAHYVEFCISYNNLIREASYIDYSYEKNLKELNEIFQKHINDIEEFYKFFIRYEPADSVISTDKVHKYIFQYIQQKPIEQSLKGKLLDFNKKLEGVGEEDIFIPSLFNYLYILASKKIENSDIAVDSISNKIVIYYSENSEHKSRKISIIPNERDFTISVLSRKEGFAKLRGVFTPSFPEAYYKIDFLLESLV